VLESINLRNNYNEEGTKLTSQTLDYSLSYTARKGDNLSAIANKLHTSVKILADQNHISNPDRINVGQKISYSNQQTEKTN
jgi:LysM repeat protein